VNNNNRERERGNTPETQLDSDGKDLTTPFLNLSTLSSQPRVTVNYTILELKLEPSTPSYFDR